MVVVIRTPFDGVEVRNVEAVFAIGYQGTTRDVIVSLYKVTRLFSSTDTQDGEEGRNRSCFFYEGVVRDLYVVYLRYTIIADRIVATCSRKLEGGII